jgi:hypothetical protein
MRHPVHRAAVVRGANKIVTFAGFTIAKSGSPTAGRMYTGVYSRSMVQESHGHTSDGMLREIRMGRKMCASLWAMIVGMAVLAFGQMAVAGTTAYNGSARWWTKNISNDFSTWAFFNPSPSDTFTCTATDSIDGVAAGGNYGPEAKFPDPLADKAKSFNAWSGYLEKGPGPLGSNAYNLADGTAYPNPGTYYGTNWVFSMRAIAGGTLGGGAGASWDSKTEIDDPSYMGPSAFSAIPSGGAADVYVPVAIFGDDGGSAYGPEQTYVSPTGTVTLNVDIATATTTYDLFDLTIQGSTGGATITPSPLGSNVSYYLQSSLEEGPPTESAISLADLETAIESDMSDGMIMSDLNIGIVFSGMAVPTQAIDDEGDLAAVEVDDSAEDSAVGVPEPGIFGYVATTAVFALRRRRTGK